MANITHQVSVDGGSWIDKGTATNHTASSLGAGSHSIRVRAVNKTGAGAIGNGGAGTVSNPPPPAPSVEIIGKGAYETCTDGGTCRRALVRFTNVPSGTYSLAISSGGWTSPWPSNAHISGNGTAESGGYLGTRSSPVCVVITGPQNFTPCVSAATWNSWN